MSTGTRHAAVTISGPAARETADDLHALLTAESVPADPVRVDRSIETVVAVISLALTAVQTADVLWNWIQARRRAVEPASGSVKVHVVLPDGTQIDLTTASHAALRIALAPTPTGDPRDDH